MDELVKKIRDFLLRAEKGTALLLNYEFDELQKEVEAYLQTILDEAEVLEHLDEILEEVRRVLAKRTVRFAESVSRAQKRVVASTATTLNAELKTSIFQPDVPAIQKLIGRTQDGGPLTKIFNQMETAVRDAAKDALVEGMTAGDSSAEIARRLNDVADLGKVRALTIARTETTEAYRSASREFYDQAGISGYVWTAILDPRTCLICWRLHGTIWPSSKKVSSHPNCRCVMLPFMDQQIKTGEERFAELEPGYQKQILGPKRFDLYAAGYKLSDLIGSGETENYGLRHFIIPLTDL